MSSKKSTQIPKEETKIETLKSIYDHNFHLIELADNKATAILTVNGIMLTVILALIGVIGNFFSVGTAKEIVTIVFFILYLISCISSLVFSILTITPLQRTGVLSPKHVFYYVNILENQNLDKFQQELHQVLNDFDLIEKGFVEQIFSISVVNKRKYKYVKWCVWTLLSSFVLVGVFLVLIILN
ncbi:MAG: hypothetical protein FK730_05580 [Asgard group archaeon]|nr:hypothetical protein [Asgard group archaeon]